jgi:hypothetical protein
MFSIVTWRWGTQYPVEFVNRLRSAVARNLTVPHQFVCVTNDTHGLDANVLVLKDREDYAEMRAGSRSCYRRLRMFEKDFLAGDQILHFDLDTVITGSLDSLVNRPENLVMWDQPEARIKLQHGYAYNPSIMLLRVGSYTEIWDTFRKDPHAAVSAARAAGWFGTDMSWINFCLMKKKVGTWGKKDGVLSWWKHIRRDFDTKHGYGSPAPGGDGSLPAGTRVVHFHGSMQEGPGDPEMQRKYPWIEKHWR